MLAPVIFLHGIFPRSYILHIIKYEAFIKKMQAQAAARFAPAFIFSRSVAILLVLTVLCLLLRFAVLIVFVILHLAILALAVLCLLVAAVLSGIIFGHNFFSVQKNN